MPPVENLSSATIHFLVCMACISFGLGWLSGAYEIFRRLAPNAEYYAIFPSVGLTAAISTVAALMPLILNETSLYLIIPSYWLFGAGLPAYLVFLYQWHTGHVTVYDRRGAPFLFGGTAIFIWLIPANALFFQSIVLFKCFILCSTSIVCYRFILFVRVINLMRTQNQIQANSGEVS